MLTTHAYAATAATQPLSPITLQHRDLSPHDVLSQTQEMLNFCARHHIGADIEVISADKINDAYERVLASDVRYRFVSDTATLK